MVFVLICQIRPKVNSHYSEKSPQCAANIGIIDEKSNKDPDINAIFAHFGAYLAKTTPLNQYYLNPNFSRIEEMDVLTVKMFGKFGY